MVNAFIIHGTNGNSEENWFPWLKRELEKIGVETIVPNFPTGFEQNLTNWLHTFEQYIKSLDHETIFVGHSIGPAFILSLLETLDTEVRAAFLVAPFVSDLNLPEFYKLNSSFVEREFNWDKIKVNCSGFYVYASDNDPYVTLDKSKYVAEQLGAEFNVIHNAGHFNAAVGYLKFERLLNDIKKLIK